MIVEEIVVTAFRQVSRVVGCEQTRRASERQTNPFLTGQYALGRFF